MKKAVYLQFTNPGAYPPLIHSSDILLEAGWQVLFLGLDPHGESRAIVMPERQGREVRMLKWVAPGIRQKLHFLRFILWTIIVVIVHRADLVYCSDPFSAPSGLLLRKMGCRVIYHEHDSPGPGEENNLPRLIVEARRKILCQASLVIFPNQLRLKRAQKWSGSNVSAEVVWNCPSRKELVSMDKLYPIELKEEHSLRLYYHGTLVPERLPLSILDAISICNSRVALTLVGYTTEGSYNYNEKLKKYADKLGIGNRLCISGALPTRNDILTECSKHDVGIVVFTGREGEVYAAEMAGASNKPFDYLSQVLAVIVPNSPAWEKLYIDNGCAVAANPDDTRALADLFDWLARNKKEVLMMGQRGRNLIEQEWNYEQQFQPVLEWIESLYRHNHIPIT